MQRAGFSAAGRSKSSGLRERQAGFGATSLRPEPVAASRAASAWTAARVHASAVSPALAEARIIQVGSRCLSAQAVQGASLTVEIRTGGLPQFIK